jgi:hypothetical protein
MAASNAPILSWANIIGTLLFGSVVIGGQWAITQSQFNSVFREFAEWKDVTDRRDNRQQVQIDLINSELSSRKDSFRHEFASKEEFALERKYRDDRWRAQDAINAQSINAFVQLKAFEANKEAIDRVIARLQVMIDEQRKRLDAVACQHKPCAGGE